MNTKIINLFNFNSLFKYTGQLNAQCHGRSTRILGGQYELYNLALHCVWVNGSDINKYKSEFFHLASISCLRAKSSVTKTQKCTPR